MQLRMYRVVWFYQWCEYSSNIKLLWLTLFRNMSVSPCCHCLPYHPYPCPVTRVQCMSVHEATQALASRVRVECICTWCRHAISVMAFHHVCPFGLYRLVTCRCRGWNYGRMLYAVILKAFRHSAWQQPPYWMCSVVCLSCVGGALHFTS